MWCFIEVSEDLFDRSLFIGPNLKVLSDERVVERNVHTKESELFKQFHEIG